MSGTGTERVAILDAFSGIAGDMTLGALVAVGLDVDWLRALPATLGLDGVVVRVQDVLRGELACKKVDFDIPPQPHGRHIGEIRRLVAAVGLGLLDNDGPGILRDRVHGYSVCCIAQIARRAQRGAVTANLPAFEDSP